MRTRSSTKAELLDENAELRTRLQAAEEVLQAVQGDEVEAPGASKQTRAQKKLSWLASFPEKNPMPVVEVDLASGEVHYLNPAAKRLFPDLRRLGLRHPFLAGLESLAVSLEHDRRAAARREVEVGDCWYEQSVYTYDGRQRLRAYGFEISQRKKREEELDRLRRTLVAHTQSSHAMLRATHEAEYLEEVCRIIVEDCGHAMVWIGYAEDDEAKTVRPVAHAGFEEGYLDTLNITWADTKRGRGPTGTAIRTAKPAMCRDMRHDPGFAPWRKEARKRGYASSIGLPLVASGRAFGAVTIYSREPDSFSDEEVKLLADLADDLAFGITAIRLRQAHADAEAALRKSEERYRVLVDSAPDAVIVHRDGRFLYANIEALRLYGAPGFKQLAARRVLDLVPPTDREQARSRIDHATGGGSLPRREARILRLDGQEVPVESAVTPIMYGGTGAVLAFLRDITERKRAEERFQIAAESLSDVIYEWDLGDRVEWFGDVDGLMGYGPGEFPRTLSGWATMLHPEDRDRVLAAVQHHLSSEAPYDVEYRVRKKDGSYSYWSARGKAVRAASGEAVRWIGAITDVTARVRAQEALRETRDYLENLFSYANAPIIVWDPDLKITRFNRAFERLTGRRAEDVIGRHLELLFPVGSREESLEHIRRAVAGERWEVVEIPIERVDGSVRTVLWNSATILDADGTTAVATMAQGQDITERKQAEEALADALGQARRRTAEVSALLSASRAVLQQRSFTVAAKEIFDSCKGLVGATAGYFALSTPDKFKFDPAFLDPGKLSGPFDLDTSMPVRDLRAEACRRRRTMVDNNLLARRWTDVAAQGQADVDNVLFAPLVIHDEAMGVLNLSNKPGGFSDDDIRLATAFAEMASVALLNSRTLDLLEKNQEVLEGLVAERTQQLQAANESLRDEIAERRQTEAELRISEKRFRDLFENVFDGVYETDIARELRTVNSALVSMLGYESKEEVIRAFKAGVLWNDGKEIDTLWQRLQSEGNLRGVEITLRCKDGSLVNGLINVNAVDDASGKAMAYQGTISDITALKRAEEALEAERLQLKSVLETMQDSVCIISRDLGVEYVNPAAQREFGNLDGHPCYTFLHGRDEPCPWCHNDAVFAGEQLSWEWTVPGTGKTYEAFATRLRNADGTLSKLEIFHDVSERKVAEGALRAERARFFGVLDQLPLFVYLRAPDHSVVFANRYFRQEFGHPEGKPCFEVMGRRGTPCEGCDFARVFGSGVTVEWEWTAPNGKDYQVHHYPFVDSDGTRLVLALGVDVTERKLAYEAEQVARKTADTLREASLGLTRTLDADAVLFSLLRNLRRLVPFDRAKVMLLSGEHLSVRAVLDATGSVQILAEPRPSFHPSENPVIDSILTVREAVLIPDIHEHPAFGPRADPAFEHCWLGVPLVARGTAIGMYSLGKRDAGSITVEHQQLAEALSAQAAVAVQNALLFEQVQAAGTRMQTLSRLLVEVQETERRTMARELHDEASQSLTSLLFGLRLLEKELTGNETATAQIADLKHTTDAVMEDLHRLATDLRPASLEHLGLVGALRQHLARVESTSGIAVRFMARGLEDERLPNGVETTIFRVVQEALTNVLRHARASRVDVLAERRDDRVIVVVEDDGVGFDPERTDLGGRLGRVGMRERAEALGGTLTVESSPGAGTTVAVEVPYADSRADRR